jgi:tryptophan-rich sensory protein
MKHGLTLAVFIALVLGGGLAIGYVTAPGAWYAELSKPSFNPPAGVFAPAWTALYILIAIAGWRTWARDRAGWPLKLWGAQLALNFLWSPTFFSAHQIVAALAVILALLVLILAFMVVSWRQDRATALLFAPYAAWVGFAATLNGAILVLNPTA